MNKKKINAYLNALKAAETAAREVFDNGSDADFAEAVKAISNAAMDLVSDCGSGYLFSNIRIALRDSNGKGSLYVFPNESALFSALADTESDFASDMVLVDDREAEILYVIHDGVLVSSIMMNGDIINSDDLRSYFSND